MAIVGCGSKALSRQARPMSGLPLAADLATPVQDGRIRYARERSPGIWLWTITVTIPGASFGSAATLDDAKTQFKAARQAFKDKHGPERLAKVLRGNEPREPGGAVSAVS
ncbi:hypothetical protein [Bradyrhizobium elkanii]|uniref:hypothetical protein n=1 Tax=Bradyrhizobium elkanii TaxID=29448 RepID=UPI00209EA2C3|nr:hypothetical protein [Bradyrhizobium elkanii]MCP1972667.1 hypothetical protein [Bradyrhizobium elkanii]MCS3519863.1 hypothetical protein [Bradyrhizobium elkanii]MCS4067518.1 hypothetical protein [Bradyrhizobium elkanii]MCS4083054.1 hypothetical protein [Bradyrhizobium elkanii]MCS4105825.1 hypothetical protein [Bradyrhizobium elkanii]